jgi:phosphatidylglycerophosphatase A
MLYKIAKFFATVCYIGKIKFAPGTFGSIAAFPICYFILYYALKHEIIFEISNFDILIQQFLSIFFIEIMATIILLIAGTYFTAIYIKNSPEKDPSEVVIDEVVGQMLTIICCSFSIILIYSSSSLLQKMDSLYINFTFVILLPFALFRFFDIVKPWPIDWLDKNVKGAIGVMIDDVAAAVFAIIIHYVIVFFVIDFFPLTS